MRFLLIFLLCFNTVFAQKAVLKKEINKILSSKPAQPFNGVVVIKKGNKTLYKKVLGFSENGKLQFDDRFVIGSISKQFTGALLLQEIDAGRLNPQIPIRNYLPDLPQKWADTVTVHHLITHLHGIRKLDEPTIFPVGTQYEYSQIGFELIGNILEKTSGKTFANLSAEWFRKCGLESTSHPSIDSSKVNAYTLDKNGVLELETASLRHYVPAGAFISNAEDLLKWNKMLYSGELFSKESMKLLTTKHPVAVRNHPFFGITEYGYGITVDTKDGILQYGQTGFTPGFASMSFYYPDKDVSLVILSNVVWNDDDLSEAFYYHMKIWKTLRDNLK